MIMMIIFGIFLLIAIGVFFSIYSQNTIDEGMKLNNLKNNFCSTCGNQIENDAIFCSSCGRKIKNTNII